MNNQSSTLASFDSGTNAPSIVANSTHGAAPLEERAYHPPLIVSDPYLAYPYLAIIGVAILLGVVGNLLILFVSLRTRNKGITKTGGELIVNQALADLCIAMIGDPFCVVGLIKGEKFFAERKVLCQLVGASCLTACFCSMMSIAGISANRYAYLCHGSHYYKFFSKPKCITLCVIIWVLAFLMDYPNLIGIGEHSFDVKIHSCIWNRMANFSYTVFVTTIVTSITILFTATCYVRIFMYIFNTKARLAKANFSDNTMATLAGLKSGLKSSRSLCIIFLAFAFFWIPYAVVTVVDVYDKFHVGVHLYITLFAHMHASVNFLIYMASNAGFRKSLVKAFRFKQADDDSSSTMTKKKTNSTDTLTS